MQANFRYIVSVRRHRFPPLRSRVLSIASGTRKSHKNNLITSEEISRRNQSILILSTMFSLIFTIQYIFFWSKHLVALQEHFTLQLPRAAMAKEARTIPTRVKKGSQRAAPPTLRKEDSYIYITNMYIYKAINN